MKQVILLIRRAIKVFVRAIILFSNRGGWIMSSYVAMSMMLALFPFILFVVSLAALLSQNLIIDDLITLIFGTWPDEIARPIEIEVRAVIAFSSQNLITIGGILAIFFASNGVDAVREAMSRSYRESDPRPFWKRRLISLGFVVLGALVVLILASVGLVLPIYMNFASDVAPDFFHVLFNNETLLLGLTGLLVLGAVTACHVWLPYGAHYLRQIWPGIVLTLGLWLLAAQAFSYYISRFATYNVTYAGLAGAMAALIFLNLMSAILIFGAEFNNALIEDQKTDVI